MTGAWRGTQGGTVESASVPLGELTPPEAWTRGWVELCLKRAVAVIAALPLSPRYLPPRRLRSGMPQVVRDVREAYGYHGPPLPRPTPRQITQAGDAVAWLLWLPELRNRNVVMARLFGLDWAVIAYRDGRSRQHLYSHVYRRGLELLAARLQKDPKVAPRDFTDLTEYDTVIG